MHNAVLPAQDPADQEQDAMRQLLGYFPRIDELAERTRTQEKMLAARVGSDLHADDTRSNPFHVSTAASMAVGVSVDHLEALKGMTNPSGNTEQPALMFYMTTHWTLLRAALENVCKAIWLLGPADSDERITRVLRLQIDNIVHSDEAASLLGVQMPSPKADRVKKVKDVAASCGISNTQAQKRVSYPEMVRFTGDFIADLADHVEFLWRACSGAAHGDTWAVLSLQDRSTIASDSRGVDLVQMGANVVGLALVVGEVLEIVETAVGLFDHRNDVSTSGAA